MRGDPLWRGLLLLVAGALLLAPAAGAQTPVSPPRPAAPATQPADTAARDSAGGTQRQADPAADSVIAELRKLQGYIATEYAADSATYLSAERVLRLRGNARVQREGDILEADSIVYRDADQLIEARGSPKVSGQAQELSGSILYYDIATRRATAAGARTQVTQNATWYVTGELVSAVGTERIYAQRGHFTTCDLDTPHYHFESDRIKVVKDKLLVAVPARLYFGKVPVMVLPFVVQNLEKGRRSGLLVPRFSVTDIVRNSPGYTRQISDLGWYWAINDYLGGQVAGTWRSGAYVSLLGNLDFNWRRQFLNGNAGFSRYFRSNGGREFGVNSRGSWRPDERTNLGLSANYQSSAQFIRETTVDPREATQDMISTLNVSRRFDWGTANFGSDLRKSIADGGITATLPSFAISPNPVTLFRQTNPDLARWYNNVTMAGDLSGSRSINRDRSDFARRIQDDTRTQLRGGLSQLSIGNLNLSATGSLNQSALEQVIGLDPNTGAVIDTLRAANIDVADWNASIGYQQRLVGQTMITPNLSLSQQVQRDTLTGGEWISGPRRTSFGASTSSAVFGFYPGFGGFSAIRHRVSPTMSYSYAPEVSLSEMQRRVFGASGGYAQNRVSLGLNQTWEAKLRDPEPQPESRDSTTSVTGDTVGSNAAPAAPVEPQKVTLLSVNTSTIEYDFVRAAKEGNGFVTEQISNSITSDYMRGLSVQMQHDLFDKRALNPSNPADRGKLGRFAPRLSSLSTGFDLGPNSSIFRWLGLFNERNAPTQGVIPGSPPSDRPTPAGSPSFTNNPRSTGGGQWRMGLRYSFTRPARLYAPEGFDLDDRAIQTIDADMAFPLTPNWAATWNTSFSMTDGEFAGHRLNFKRDLHRWQANFSFYQTPTGNTAFEFYVELIDNPDIKFDHRERNLGIDRARRQRTGR